jgi:hypothetical protein
MKNLPPVPNPVGEVSSFLKDKGLLVVQPGEDDHPNDGEDADGGRELVLDPGAARQVQHEAEEEEDDRHKHDLHG